MIFFPARDPASRADPLLQPRHQGQQGEQGEEGSNILERLLFKNFQVSNGVSRAALSELLRRVLKLLQEEREVIEDIERVRV